MTTYKPHEQSLVDRFPEIDWSQAQPVQVLGSGRWLTCRFCTAIHGLKAVDVPRVGFASRAEHAAHLRAKHEQQES